MADVISLLPSALIVTAGTSKTMPYTDAIDVSAYKSIDLQIDIPGNVPKGAALS